MYLRTPDVIAHEARKNFMAQSSSSNCDILHISTNSIPVEAAHTMSIVECHHAPLWHTFNIIAKEAPDVDKVSALQIAVKSVNDSVGPYGMVSIFLVLGAIPRLVLLPGPPATSTLKRAFAVRRATEAMFRHFVKRQVRDSIRSQNGPNVSKINKAAVGSPVLIHRPEKYKWEGPLSLLDTRGEGVVVLVPFPFGPTEFRFTVVRPYVAKKVPCNNESSNLAS